MNPAEVATSLLIERTLSGSSAYRKIEDALYVVKQGSSYVLINVVPWVTPAGSAPPAGTGTVQKREGALVRVFAQLVKGARMDGALAQQLLRLNARMRFGAFAYEPAGQLVIFQHSILGGDTLDPEELVATVRDVALIADEYDDKIVKKYGGQTMRDLLEEAAYERVLAAEPGALELEPDEDTTRLGNGERSAALGARTHAVVVDADVAGPEPEEEADDDADDDDPDGGGDDDAPDGDEPGTARAAHPGKDPGDDT